MKKDTLRQIEDQKQFNTLMENMDNYNLMQKVQELKIEKNTLDLVFVRNPEIFTHL